ncbi:hypothetical protein [uncultured Draconibacterium sp.]|uniref:hypothetical protein n=1 Tax=uncultured Draconibacterium sp. TaxID=1573823 RepID=UPI002AA715AD|nr:hypothetical protein [uncultured Draconibacterium sp.]
MKRLISILLILLFAISVKAKSVSVPDFTWGNAHYYNLNIGDSVQFNGINVVLHAVENHFNTLIIQNDTVKLKVSRRSLPTSLNSIRVFVADNKNVKKMASNKEIHGLLKKDALICLSETKNHMLSPGAFIFPVSYNDGFNWNLNEDNYMFSYEGNGCFDADKTERNNEGIGIALTDSRGIDTHWLLAMENSTVVWIEEKEDERKSMEACILLQSNSNPSVFYVYDHLYKNNIDVKEGQQIRAGELLGTSWGDDNWGYLQLAVVYSDTVPAYKNRFANCINFFPQLYELYFKNTFGFAKTFTRGKVDFGLPPVSNGNQKNILAFEEYTGKGWILGSWNTAEKVMYCTTSAVGNARLKKVLFEGKNALCRNPKDYFEYEINVRNGVYRIRSLVGDVKLASWQKIEYEGIEAATYNLKAGELKWTSEKVVKVNDRRLTIRIYVDPSDQKVAGISEVVFQQAY